MIDSFLNLLFRCAHRRLTSPLTPVRKAGLPRGDTYVVCLDCGKQFAYDLTEMRIGKPIDHSNEACVLPPDAPKQNTKLKYAALAALPLAVLIGATLKGKKRGQGKIANPAEEPGKSDNGGHGSR